MFSCAAAAALLLAIPFSAHAEPQVTEIDDSIPWEVTSSGDDVGEVSTWRREIPGADVKQFRGEVILNEPALNILLTIDTPEDLHKWVYFCRDSAAVPPEYSYMEYKGVWPVAARYVTIKSKSWIENDVIYISSRNVDEAVPEHDNMVKIREFSNLFEITPLGEDMTKVRFTTFVDLAGKLPSWLANAVSSRAPYVTLSGMRDLLEDGERDFSDASVDDLSSVAQDKDGLRRLLAKLDNIDDSDPLDPNDD
ncbi:MAG: hypothetical protein CMI07_01260 [Oceanospirillaceae bacterium]|nr:hypothetical protein [Oceanospirillaceae bacterium]|tara:strand:+ start:1618 stop:2370 length:753 start_codon:yes stop_codon:yes gene_type:complete